MHTIRIRYSYVCDGATPGFPVLSDGHTIFTAGLSSTINNMTSFRHEDALGSLRFLTDAGQSVLGSSVYEAFGTAVGATGATAKAPFGWVGGADCQTEADTGLVLMGHRYYDSRVGRFISQDPKRAGSNWYAYCHNNPVNKTDPMGLSEGLPWQSGAPDRRYGGIAGSDGGGMFGGGTGGLDQFFRNENAAMERGQLGFYAGEAIRLANITGPDGYAKHIRGMLNEIAASPIGLSLLSTVYLKKILNIEYYHNTEHPNSWYVRSSDTLQYDPMFHVRVNTSEGLSDSPPINILEHELGHDITGLSDTPDGTTIFDTHMRDNIAVNENPFRAYLGLPDRIDHGGATLPDGSVFDDDW